MNVAQDKCWRNYEDNLFKCCFSFRYYNCTTTYLFYFYSHCRRCSMYLCVEMQSNVINSSCVCACAYHSISSAWTVNVVHGLVEPFFIWTVKFVFIHFYHATTLYFRTYFMVHCNVNMWSLTKRCDSERIHTHTHTL